MRRYNSPGPESPWSSAGQLGLPRHGRPREEQGREAVMTYCPTCGSDPERELAALARDIAALSQMQGELTRLRETLFGPPAPGSSQPVPGTAGTPQKGTALRAGTAP